MVRPVGHQSRRCSCGQCHRSRPAPPRRPAAAQATVASHPARARQKSVLRTARLRRACAPTSTLSGNQTRHRDREADTDDGPVRERVQGAVVQWRPNDANIGYRGHTSVMSPHRHLTAPRIDARTRRRPRRRRLATGTATPVRRVQRRASPFPTCSALERHLARSRTGRLPSVSPGRRAPLGPARRSNSQACRARGAWTLPQRASGAHDRSRSHLSRETVALNNQAGSGPPRAVRRDRIGRPFAPKRPETFEGGAEMIDADAAELIARVPFPAWAGELVHEHGGDDPERRPDHECVIHRSVWTIVLAARKPPSERTAVRTPVQALTGSVGAWTPGPCPGMGRKIPLPCLVVSA